MSYKNTPTSEELQSLLAHARAEHMEDGILEKLSAILYFAEHAYSISDTCRTFGISRSTFHRWMDRFDPQNIYTLADKSHDPLTKRHSTVSAEVIDLIRRYRIRYPHMGKERIAELLMRDVGINISASSVGRIIERECLYFADTPCHWKKRLQYQSLNAQHDGAVVPESVFQEEAMQQEQTAASLNAIAQTPIAAVSLGNANAGITMSWKGIVRFFVVVSFLTNVVFVGLLLFSAFVESTESKHQQQNPAIEYQSADPMHAASTDPQAS